MASALAVAAGLAAAVILLTAAPALAHALPKSSDPAPGAVLKQSPTTVTIVFGETPDPRLSLIQVLDSGGQNRTSGKTTPVPGDPQGLEVNVAHLPDGVYTVSWRTVSEVDGHLAAGTFAFGVGVAPTGATATGSFSARSTAPSATSVASRWFLYVGLMGLVGGMFLALVCYRTAPRRLLRLVALAWVVGLVGTGGITFDARRAAQLPWSQVLVSSLGHELLWRAVPLLVAAVPIAWILPRPTADGRRRLRSALLAVVGAAGLAAMWGDVQASHAAASHSLRLLRMADQWAHFAAAGIWAGGLTILLLTVGLLDADVRRRSVRRFSQAAVACVAVVAATGFERAYEEIGTLHSLLHIGFGQYVLLKIGLLGVLVALGAVNRYRSLPAMVRDSAASSRRLQFVGRLELVALAAVLVATAIIQGLAPPTTSAQSTVHPLVLSGSDFATTVKVKLSISPDMSGFNAFTVSAVDYDTGRPVADTTAVLTFDLPSQPTLGSSTLALKTTSPGQYSATGPNLSLDGTWTITLALQEPSGGVEIPFTVTPRVPPTKLVVQPEGSGLPTLYTVDISGGRSIQTYLDPGHTGALNEFHTTFIAQSGEEIPMAGLTDTATGPGPDATPMSLPVRRLDTIGHFVADLSGAVKGRYLFHFVGTTTGGSVIDGTVAIPVS